MLVSPPEERGLRAPLLASLSGSPAAAQTSCRDEHRAAPPERSGDSSPGRAGTAGLQGRHCGGVLGSGTGRER